MIGDVPYSATGGELHIFFPNNDITVSEVANIGLLIIGFIRPICEQNDHIVVGFAGPAKNSRLVDRTPVSCYLFTIMEREQRKCEIDIEHIPTELRERLLPCGYGSLDCHDRIHLQAVINEGHSAN